MPPCPECARPLTVHDDNGALVCTDCGTLADPAHVLLVNHTDYTPAHAPPRTSNGWHLANTKQLRDKRNMIAMSTFVASVLSRLNSPGLSSRAEAIFTQAMVKGRYRWGRRAKLAAGASIAVALREAHKSDSLHDIAFLLDETPLALSRSFRSVVSLLDLSLDSTDPAVHLPILHVHLQSIIHPENVSPVPPSQLPTPLASILKTLSLHVAVRTATSLAQIVSHHSPPLPLSNLPTPPTACALLMLGLEAEARAPLPHLGELARTLASRFAFAPGVVSSRYKSLYTLIEEWIRHVPWLDQFVDKHKGRTKGTKRSIVAKGIKDVVQFQQEIWLRRMQNQENLLLDLELDPSGEQEGDQADIDEADTSTSTSPVEKTEQSVIAPLPNKRRRKVERNGDVMQAAYRFLLDPLSSGSLRDAVPGDEVSLLSHILTCSYDQLSRIRGTPPRLQLLAASRGGSTTDHIADEELFIDGELEGFLRSEQERVALQPLFELNWGEETSKEKAAVTNQKPIAAEMKRGAKRINMDALTHILGGNGDSSHEDDAAEFPDSGNEAYLRSWDDDALRSSGHQSTAEVVNDWMLATPDEDEDIFGAFYTTADDRYEQEL